MKAADMKMTKAELFLLCIERGQQLIRLKQDYYEVDRLLKAFDRTPNVSSREIPSSRLRHNRFS